MSSPRQILFVGGPLDGIVHELYGGLMPSRIGLPYPEDTSGPGKCKLHWYTIKDGKGYFDRTEDAKEE